MVLRAKQTAEIISASRIPIQYDGRLLETLTVFQGFPKDEWNKYGGFHEGLGGETPLEIQKRIVNFFEKNNWENGHEYIVVSHGDPSYFLYKYLKKQPIEEKEYTQNLGKYGTFSHESEYQKKGSIRIISKENKEWVVGEYLQNNELINN